MATEIIYKEESYNIIGAAFEVHSKLGCGFPELVYQEALAMEFEQQSIPFEREKPYYVEYKGVRLAKSYRPDFVCYDKIIVEIKALDNLCSLHEAQVYSYLKASGFKLGILINFGKESLEQLRLPSTKKW